jgi:hypothetical protein
VPLPRIPRRRVYLFQAWHTMRRRSPVVAAAPSKANVRQWFSDGIGGEGDNFLLYFICNS